MATTDTLAHSSRWPGWPDARGWIGLGSFVLTILVLLLIWRDPDLRKDEFFKTIATLIIGTGWVNGVLAWRDGFVALLDVCRLCRLNRENGHVV